MSACLLLFFTCRLRQVPMNLIVIVSLCFTLALAESTSAPVMNLADGSLLDEIQSGTRAAVILTIQLDDHTVSASTKEALSIFTKLALTFGPSLRFFVVDASTEFGKHFAIRTFSSSKHIETPALLLYAVPGASFPSIVTTGFSDEERWAEELEYAVAGLPRNQAGQILKLRSPHFKDEL